MVLALDLVRSVLGRHYWDQGTHNESSSGQSKSMETGIAEMETQVQQYYRLYSAADLHQS